MSRRRSWRKRRAERCRILAARCVPCVFTDHEGPYLHIPSVPLWTEREAMDAAHLVRAGGYEIQDDGGRGSLVAL